MNSKIPYYEYSKRLLDCFLLQHLTYFSSEFWDAERLFALLLLMFFLFVTFLTCFVLILELNNKNYRCMEYEKKKDNPARAS